MEYARPVPLTIAVRYPEDRGASVAEESTVAAAVVTSGKGVARVLVSLNGVAVADQERERTPQTSVVVTTPLTLRAGTNTTSRSPPPTPGAWTRPGGADRYARSARWRPPPPPRAGPSASGGRSSSGRASTRAGDPPAALRGARRRGRLPDAHRARRLPEGPRGAADRLPSASRRCATSGGRSAPSWPARRRKDDTVRDLLRRPRRPRGRPARRSSATGWPST